MTITGGSALPKDDIERMMREAEAHAEEDRARKEDAETRNQAETLVYQTEKFLRENTDSIPAPEKDTVDTALANLKKALEGTDIAAVRTATDELAAESQKMGSAIYANAQATNAAAGQDGSHEGGESGPTDGAGDGADEVIDAEIVDEGTS
jgi:molecular chaperone DnaK